MLTETVRLRLHPSQLVKLLQFDSNTEYVWRPSFFPMAIRRNHKRPIRQDFNARVRTVPSVVIVLQSHVILAFAAMHQIVVSADPGNPITFRGGPVIMRGPAAERDK